MSELKAGLYDEAGSHSIFIDDEVIEYMKERNTDFRISTSCGGPILLPVSYKPPKPSDLALKAGERTIYISMYQARYIDHIHMGLVPYHVGMRDEAFPDEYNGL
ncbi:hypothetical protein KHC33_00830 [Methanospirillum sp. J.3.6.1-F.2.7.3]|jgi:hypothetical protein|uniref:Uncharacterized protein n=1 Tax=Methanospirillum purgamenti TaxID=2834276 RepID=A0A8E7B130_9EURY|nr:MULTISPECIES: hypothetical protein [Methanospirillum]MDX8551742.1 hypothetical protein [Methanospirillum hungatei]QVV89111.1 hypothetical protein KHC33_00830 [Methanospirillum sp. J.3.6.1-F.2.7.3]